VAGDNLVRTPFDRDSTALEVIEGIDLSGKRGTKYRSRRAAAADIVSTTGSAEVFVEPLELTDSGSVQAFTAAWRGPLHILVNNAAAKSKSGDLALPQLERTARGWEMQFAINHLGHFELALGLHAALAAAGAARIVAVSSSAHLMSPVIFDDVHFEQRDYDPWLGYAQSKTANVLFSVEASRRWAGDGITANALMPGGINTKPDQQKGHPEDLDDWDPALRAAYLSYRWKTPRQGAATSVLLAVSPLLEGVGGRYFEDCNEAAIVVPPATAGVADYAIDPVAAERLWEMSIEMLNS
jgi:NAD(P)-dependent dehydrogenase (short-subunit alcohol dehydrogenase family)